MGASSVLLRSGLDRFGLAALDRDPEINAVDSWPRPHHAAGTLTTLFVLPAVFTFVMGWAGTASASLDPFDPASPRFVPIASPLADEVPARALAVDPHLRASFG